MAISGHLFGWGCVKLAEKGDKQNTTDGKSTIRLDHLPVTVFGPYAQSRTGQQTAQGTFPGHLDRRFSVLVSRNFRTKHAHPTLSLRDLPTNDGQFL